MRVLKFEKDVSENKVASFVVGIITFVLACVMTFVCFSFGLGLHPKSAGEALAILVVWPIAVILYMVMLSFVLTSGLSFLNSCFSAKRWIKVTSIVMTVLSVALLSFNVYMVLVSLGVV